MKTINMNYFGTIPKNYTGIVECASGDKHWFKNGQLHRLNGPAIEQVNGCKAWYIHNQSYTEKEYNTRMEFYKSASGKYYL